MTKEQLGELILNSERQLSLSFVQPAYLLLFMPAPDYTIYTWKNMGIMVYPSASPGNPTMKQAIFRKKFTESHSLQITYRMEWYGKVQDCFVILTMMGVTSPTAFPYYLLSFSSPYNSPSFASSMTMDSTYSCSLNCARNTVWAQFNERLRLLFFSTASSRRMESSSSRTSLVR